MKASKPPVIRQLALASILAAIPPERDWLSPDPALATPPERASHWFKLMRSAVDQAPDSVCLLCGSPKTHSVPCNCF